MKFEKWQGCGNDFILVHSSELDRPLAPDRVRALCDRRLGIGADGILVVGRPTGARWPVEIHNADGSVAESCGNGSRCVVRHILDRRGIDACELATAGGIVRGRREGDLIGIELRVDERGVGETLACGTGACAAVAAASSRGLVDPEVAVRLPGGTLVVRAGADRYELWGSAERVFEGTV